MDETGKPRYSSVSNLAVSPEVSNKINQARSLFGGSAFSLNKVNERPLTPTRNANSVTDLTGASASGNSNANTNINTRSNDNQVHTIKPVIKTPIKFADEMKVITANNEPVKNRSTFGHIFKNFFK